MIHNSAAGHGTPDRICIPQIAARYFDPRELSKGDRATRRIANQDSHALAAIQ